MHPVFEKTFGGLSPQYYGRHFIFGLFISAFYVYMLTHGNNALQFGLLLFIAINSVLYPYSRFVYESLMGFIMGQNVFFVNAIVMLFFKLFTMVICWGMSIFIAPLGLAYLYYHHSRA